MKRSQGHLWERSKFSSSINLNHGHSWLHPQPQKISCPLNLPPPYPSSSYPESSLVLLPRSDSVVYNYNIPLQILNSLAFLSLPVCGKDPILVKTNKQTNKQTYCGLYESNSPREKCIHLLTIFTSNFLSQISSGHSICPCSTCQWPCLIFFWENRNFRQEASHVSTINIINLLTSLFCQQYWDLWILFIIVVS